STSKTPSYTKSVSWQHHLQMYMNDGTTAITPDTETGNILLQDGDQTLTFKVDYIATGKATSGNVNAVTNFHINYY
ncbi:hypothetical protein HC409_16500, partial [Escherichia coli]|nr:hypothetical protein [Escherichia coli]